MYLHTNLFNISTNKLVTSLFVLASLLLSACGGGSGSVENKTGTLTPISITITPSTSTVAKGLNTNFSATATYQDSSKTDVTNKVSWATSNTNVATIVNNTGVVTGLSEGSTTVTASLSGITSPSITLTVTSASITTITISPGTQSTAKGVSATYTATAVYSDGSSGNVSGSVTWVSSNTSVASTNPTGIVSSLDIGTANITASTTVGSNVVTSNSAALMVTAPTLSTITIGPSSANVVIGSFVNLSAIGIYSDGTTANITNQVNWTAADSNIISFYNPGVASGLTLGSTKVTASLGVISSPTASLSVIAAPVTITSIVLSPSTQSTPKGLAVPYTATAFYSNLTNANISSSVTWKTSNPTVATISSSGIATSLAVGTTTITATVIVGSAAVSSNSVSLTVNAPALTSITITPTAATVAKGLNTSFTAQGTYSDGTTADISNLVTWLSANTTISTINSTGVATGVANGSTTVTASLSGISSLTAAFTVTSASIVSITVSPTTFSTPKGTPVTYTAQATYTDGTISNVSGSVTWTSSSNTVATINSSGIAASLAVGTTTITASTIVGGNVLSSNGAALTVAAPALTAITINPTTATVAKGLNTNFTAQGAYTDGTTSNLTSQVTWSSGNTSIATINSTGVATGLSVGSATVKASVNSINSPTATLNVTVATIVSINISSAALSTPKGTSVTYTATATYSDLTSSNVSGSVTWASSNTTVATVSPSGIASSLAVGSSTISASTTVGGIVVPSNSLSLTVSQAALVSFTISPLSSNIAVYGTKQFTSSGLYTDGTVSPVPGLTWILYNAGGTINSTGVVTGTSGYSTLVISTNPVGGIGTTQSATLYVNPAIRLGGNIIGTNSGGTVGSNPLYLTGKVTTLAGSGYANGASNNGTGIAASFYNPESITTDGSNLYVAEKSNNIIRQIVIATGVVTTLAGSGAVGSTDSTGTAASFNQPEGITTDGSNLYVTDYGNSKIRKIEITTGIVTTIAGSGTSASVDGTSTAASFSYPAGITTDGANLYVTEAAKIRKIEIATGAVTTVAGSGLYGSTDGIGAAATFSNPQGITTPDGLNLYVTGSNKIRKIEISTRSVTTLAGSGVAGAVDNTGTAASFNQPWGIGTDGINLYVTENAGQLIRKIVIATGVVTTLAGSGSVGAVNATGTAAAFSYPRGITSDGGNLFVADALSYLIRKIE